MVTIITKFQAKDMRSAAKLEDIFQKLIEETLEESGYIAYEVLLQTIFLLPITSLKNGHLKRIYKTMLNL